MLSFQFRKTVVDRSIKGSLLKLFKRYVNGIGNSIVSVIKLLEKS